MSPFPLRIKLEGSDSDKGIDEDVGDADDDDLEFEENPFIIIEREVLLAPRPLQQQLSGAATIPMPVADTPFLDLFIERFIDAFAPDTRNDCGTSSAIRQAGSVSMFSPLLSEAFLAVSMAYFGQTTGSWSLMSQGHGRYRSTLEHLQAALFDPRQSRSEGVFATVVLLIAYESLQHTSEKALVNNLVGGLKLIEFRNPWNHVYGIEHACFTELLPYWVSTALIMRKPSFLAREEWKTVPWSAPGVTKDIMARLLEQVVDLPAILWRHDQFMAALRTHDKSPDLLANQQKRLWNAIIKLVDRLLLWKNTWADTYPTGLPYEVNDQGADYFPVFRYIDPLTNEHVVPPTLVYPDPQLARTLCMYYASMLLLISVDTRPPPDGLRSGTLRTELAHLVCRSMEYFIRAVPGNMINRMAFPLRVTYDSLPEGCEERRFIEEVFFLVERKNALRSWGKFIPDISSKEQRP